MPELPEVETVKNTLKKQILNLKISEITVNYKNIIKCNVDEFNSILNHKFTDILRKGKVLIFELEDLYLLTHLRMEGKFFYKDNIKDVSKHDHIIFKLSNNHYLIYNDVRKFGSMTVKNIQNLYNTEPLSKVSDEPFDIDINTLYNRLSTKSIPIKQSLLDQEIMSGLGNIYVDEVLYLSKINPLKPTKSLSLKEVKDVVANSISILNKAIELKGCTIRSYTSSLGVKGEYQNHLNVHTKSNEPCPKCGELILKIKVNGRGTYYCHKCQK
ncbi:MAG: DNA-formamidopyrimidine glycosylase [Anaeroplasmataceae bacterium]